MFPEAAIYMSGQPFLGSALPTSSEEGPRKGGLNIAYFNFTWVGNRTYQGISYAVETQEM